MSIKNFLTTSCVLLSLSTLSLNVAQAQYDQIRTEANKVGNGGAVAYCRASSSDEGSYFSQGYFTVDHLNSAIPSNSDTHRFLAEKTYDDVIEKILTLLKPFPKLAVSLREFRNTFAMPGGNDLYSWEPNLKENLALKIPVNSTHDAINGLPYDGRSLSVWGQNIPKNCYGDTKEDLYFPVILIKSEKLTYHYNPELISSLEENGSELSWLIVHEWLWLYLDNSYDVFILNQALHKNLLTELSKEKLKALLSPIFQNHRDLVMDPEEVKKNYNIFLNYANRMGMSPLENGISNEKIADLVSRIEGYSSFSSEEKEYIKIYIAHLQLHGETTIEGAYKKEEILWAPLLGRLKNLKHLSSLNNFLKYIPEEYREQAELRIKNMKSTTHDWNGSN